MIEKECGEDKGKESLNVISAKGFFWRWIHYGGIYFDSRTSWYLLKAELSMPVGTSTKFYKNMLLFSHRLSATNLSLCMTIRTTKGDNSGIIFKRVWNKYYAMSSS